MTQRCEICDTEIEYGWPVSCLHCSTHLTPLEKTAPDLLAACNQLVQFCEMMNMPDDLQTINKAKAAIAKAKGGADD